MFLSLTAILGVGYATVRKFERILGKSGLHLLKKIFGVILLSIAIKLFLTNTGIVLPHGM